MELLEKSKEVASRPEVVALDYAWKDANSVTARLEIVCSHIAKLFINKESGNAINSAQVRSAPISGSGGFSSLEPADVALLVFEVIAERNRNPQLWNKRGPGGIDDEINNTVYKFLNGPSTLGGDLSQGIRESTYAKAKIKLIQNLEARAF